MIAPNLPCRGVGGLDRKRWREVFAQKMHFSYLTEYLLPVQNTLLHSRGSIFSIATIPLESRNPEKLDLFATDTAVTLVVSTKATLPMLVRSRTSSLLLRSNKTFSSCLAHCPELTHLAAPCTKKFSSNHLLTVSSAWTKHFSQPHCHPSCSSSWHQLAGLSIL